MSAPPYQKLFWGSYHKHTAHLRHAREHGAYLLLIGALWNNEGKLPTDDTILAGHAQLSVKEWLAIKPTLMPLFKILRGRLTQPRVTDDLAKYRDTSGKRKVAGKKGGEASSGKHTENSEAIASVLPTKPEPEPKEEIETPIAPKGAAKFVLRKADVQAVWAVASDVGRKRSSQSDLEAAMVAAAKRGKAPAQVLAGVAAYFASDEATRAGGKFAKGVHRIVANDRWEPFVEGPTPLERLAAAPDPLATWRRRVEAYRKPGGYWNTNDWGPEPGQPGCTVPAAALCQPEPTTSERAA